jgi:acetyl-CoA acetyltransferase
MRRITFRAEQRSIKQPRLKRNTKRGVATLCVSGGLGMALALENVV